MRLYFQSLLSALPLLLLLTPARCTTFTCTRFKGCVSEHGLRAYCHQPRVPSIQLTVLLQSPSTIFTVYGFFSISHRIYLYRNGTVFAQPNPPRNVWCYVGIDIKGNEADFLLRNISDVAQSDFGPLTPFVENANGTSLYVQPVDQLLGGVNNTKFEPYGLCCSPCSRIKKKRPRRRGRK